MGDAVEDAGDDGYAHCSTGCQNWCGGGDTILVHREYSLRLPLYEKEVAQLGTGCTFQISDSFLAARAQI